MSEIVSDISTNPWEHKSEEIRQYAREVVAFSSQYGKETGFSYTASNLAGEMNIYPKYGDFSEACVFRTYGSWWRCCPSSRKSLGRPPDSFRSQDFIELAFEHKVYPSCIQIVETYNAGTIVKIMACDTSVGTDVDSGRDRWATLWSGKPTRCPPEARLFSQTLYNNTFPTDLIRLEFNHSFAEYYTELDAVIMYGYEPYDQRKDLPVYGNIPELEFHEGESEENIHTVIKSAGVDKKTDAHITSIMQKLALKDSFVSNLDADNGYFDLFSDEVVQLILNYLDSTSICRLGQTCRLLRQHCYDALQFTELNLKPYWYQVNDATLDSLHSRCSRLTALDLSWCGANGMVTVKGLIRLLEVCGDQLTCLYLGCCPFVSSRAVQAVCRHCPNLSILDLQSCQNVDLSGFIQIAGLSKLRYLNLYRTLIDTFSITKIVTSCSELEHLNLGSCSISDLTDVIIELAHNCRNLRSLDLWRCKTVTEVVLEALATNCPSLEELDVGWCQALRSNTGCYRKLAENCHQLKKLFLTANRTVCNADILALAQHCPLLEQLDILGNRDVSWQALERLLERCQSLRFLDVSFCADIFIEHVDKWRSEFPNVDIKRSFQVW